MAVNRDKPDRWKNDIAKSVDFYNNWFLEFAPKAFRDTRFETTKEVEAALEWTDNLNNIQPKVLRAHPEVLPMLRMSTCPPIARDRLIGLANVPANLVKSMELHSRMPKKMSSSDLNVNLMKIRSILRKLADPDIFVWLGRDSPGTNEEVLRAASIVADRLCGAQANPIIRNAQEQRQLAAIQTWLEGRNYRLLLAGEASTFEKLPPGTFSFRYNVPVYLDNGREVKIPVDVVIMPSRAKEGDFPLLVEAKSAGDFTNVNKRRKEEAVKMSQLRNTYGDKISFDLFLCGYFDSGYLGYEAAEGIDWVWEHRIDDLVEFGL